ncbi:dihydroxyacetone kinase phosphoryl donor subunit DhaM [Lacrimispora sp.]|uniref:dihydroxyacetone kinase phosphoryl donor subunit DhaM n=1 Tax=Lacrimispora sp. TaxID=2719234 RepID=UPI002867A293|nr:dihydroxyacetone kinase phosphoryl donor subunit DhaM [Lacrimispora sp.]MDR7814174.1 dihydroxyacetone kinase phosphoryl donor subunit DhaM [Lacrimispora sp.]
MVGLVIVSHSDSLAKSVVELTKIMVSNAQIAPAGGLEDGSFGTSFEKIQAAIESVYTDDGVLVLMDMGSAVMTTEMVIEMLEDKKVEMVDCPLVEGAVVASIDAAAGMDFETIKGDLAKVGGTRKF